MFPTLVSIEPKVCFSGPNLDRFLVGEMQELVGHRRFHNIGVIRGPRPKSYSWSPGHQ